MTDDDYGEGRDPLLVRPFLLRHGDGLQHGGSPGDGDGGRGGGEHDRGVSAQTTWPSATTREVRSRSAFDGADAPTAILVLPPARRGSTRRRLLVLAAVSAAVLAGAGAAAFAALRPPARPPVAAALPDMAVPAPVRPLAGATSAATATKHRAAGHTAASPTVRATSGASTVTPSAAAPVSPAPSGAPAAKSPPAAAVPQTEAAGTGEIRGSGGLCLDVAGGVAADGGHLEVGGCTGAGTQRWTVAADGTLRVSGLCALLAGDGTVHLAKCDGRTTATWWPTGTAVVNAANHGCLTDPADGARPGTTVQVTLCNATSSQRWSLP